MKRLGPLPYLVVLLLSLGAAYLTWTRAPQKAQERVPVATFEKKDLLGLELQSKNRTVSLSRQKSGYSGDSFWWVKMEGPASAAKSGEQPSAAALSEAASALSAEPRPGEGEADGDGLEEGVGAEGIAGTAHAAAGAAGAKIDFFRADARLEEALGRFCPWVALRALGSLGEDKRKELGLADTTERLVLKGRSGERTFRIGVNSYGHPDRYVEEEGTGVVYLFPGQDLRELEYPKTRFMERALNGFKKDQPVRIHIRAGGKEKELAARTAENGKAAGWADSRKPGKTNEIYQNWIQKYFGLRVLDYLPPRGGGEPEGCSSGPDASDPALRMTFFDERREIGFFVLYKTSASGNAESPYVACADHTDSLVRLPKSQVESLLQDLEDVLSES
ncbi:MAG: hypothetical protein AB1640_05445 [bacterium]